MTQSANDAGFLSLVDSFLSGERISLFDEVAKAAADSLGAYAALVSFLTPKGGAIRGSYRWRGRVEPLQFAMARWVAKLDDTLVVEDLASDERFLTNPLVTLPPRARFYAGAPINFGPDAVGALEVFGPDPRTITAPQKSILEMLASQISRNLNLWWRITALENTTLSLEERMEDLRDSRDRLLDFFDSTNDLIMTILPGGRIINANAAFTNLLGYSHEEAGVILVTELVRPENQEEFADAFQNVVRSGQPLRVETEFLTRGGPRLIVDGTLIPKLHDGQTEIVRVIFRDITIQRMAEQELVAARDAAVQGARIKSRFLANISHEIRTPIHVMQGMMELLVGGVLDPDQRDLVGTARVASESLLHTFNNVLHLSRLESGGVHPELAEVDLRSNLERLVEVMSVAGMEKGLTVTLVVDGSVPRLVRADMPRLRHVLANLIGNAVKFSDRGRIELRVSLHTSTETHSIIRFDVTDEGRGIPADELTRIFQPFHQVDASNTRTEGGIGVGLSLSHQLVDLMGGVLIAESKENAGSRFWFAIPLQRVAEAVPVTTVTPEAVPLPGVPDPPAPPRFLSRPSSLRILVAEDRPLNQKLMGRQLHNLGLNADFAATGAEAVAAQARSPYDVIFMDCQMPVMDGYDATIQIRRATGAYTRIIAMTANAMENDKERCLAAGMDDYIAKPARQRDIEEVLERCFSAPPQRQSRGT